MWDIAPYGDRACCEMQQALLLSLFQPLQIFRIRTIHQTITAAEAT